MTADRRLLLVHAHPDDESINNGATMARYVAEGAHVTLVTCTLGEEGEVLVPELADLAANRTDRLGRHRIGELTAAMKELGVSDYRFLGGPGRYRDSGMMGLPTNDRPDCFWQADLDEAAAPLVAVIREVRPQVLVTYDENGGYGHPDHIQAHRVAMRAYAAAADPDYRPPARTAPARTAPARTAPARTAPARTAPDGEVGQPWRIAKVYWNCVPRSWLQAGLDRLRAAGDTTTFQGLESAEDFPFAVPDELVTTEVDCGSHVTAKLAAMRAHATQIAVDGPFFALSNNLGQRVWGVEHYRLVRGELGAHQPGREREDDLFAGLR